MIAWAWGTIAAAAELSLTVRGKGTEGGPVAGASVTGEGVDATTDAAGHVTVTVPDAWALTVSAPGYRTLSLDGTLGGAAQRDLDVWLHTGAAETVEVVVEGLKATADTTRYAVDGEQAAETPGTLDDAVRLVQALPGVTVQREYSPSSGDLSVRGSNPGDSRYFLDGIEIPYLYHYNQYASVFPATQIGSLELFPSTFSARYGDAVGAVIEARSHEEAPTGVHGSAHLNFVMGGADVKAPLGKHGWWMSASGRRSYQDLAGEGSLQYPLWPVFSDFVARAEHGDERKGGGVFVFGASDHYQRAAGELDVLDPLEADTSPTVDYRQHYEGVGVRARRITDPRALRTSFGLVHYTRAADLAGLGGERLDQLSATSRGDGSWRFDDTGFDAGWELTGRRVGYAVDAIGPIALRVAEEAPGLARGVAVDDALWRLQGGLYGTGHFALGPVRVMPGLRVGGDSTIAELQPSPGSRRAGRSASPRRSSSAPAATPSAPTPSTCSPAPATPRCPPPAPRSSPRAGSRRSRAGWSSGSRRTRSGSSIRSSTRSTRSPTRLRPAPRPASRPSPGTASARSCFLWGWLAVQKTVTTEAVSSGDPVQVPADGDQRFSGGLVVSFDVHGWNLGARYRYASGLPFTQLEGSVYDAGRDTWVPTPGATNGARLPDYHKVDLRAAKTWEFRGWSMTLTTEVWIVPKTSAALYPTWNYDYTEQGFVRGPTFLPLLGGRVQF